MALMGFDDESIWHRMPYMQRFLILSKGCEIVPKIGTMSYLMVGKCEFS